VTTDTIDDDKCIDCGAHYEDGGDGYDGRCPDCADKHEAMQTVRAPNGNEIVGTYEMTPGRAEGSFEGSRFEHEGGTEHFYDDQLTVTLAGETVYIDEDGDHWMESQLVRVGQPLPDTIASPWENPAKVRALVEERFEEARELVLETKHVTGDMLVAVNAALDVLAAALSDGRRA
jgi:hypothetical protein